MNIKAILYTTFVRILHVLAYPLVLLSGSNVAYPSLLVYMIARCEGYPKAAVEALVKQAILETGHYQSNLFKQGKNGFGMKMPRKRPTLANSTIEATEGTFARFNTFAESIMDRIMWDRYWGIQPTSDPELYILNVQQKGYAEDSSYIDKWMLTESKLNFDAHYFLMGFYGIIAIIAILIYERR